MGLSAVCVQCTLTIGSMRLLSCAFLCVHGHLSGVCKPVHWLVIKIVTIKLGYNSRRGVLEKQVIK